MKKILVSILAAIISVSALFGCGPTINKGNVAGDYTVNLNVDPNISETLRILVPSNDGNLEKTYMSALIPGFNEKFPNVKVEFDMRAISDEKYAESIGNAIASKNAPDLFYTNTVFYYYLVAKKCIVNLEPYYKASEKAKIFNMNTDLYKSFFDMSTYKDKRYVVPRTADSVVCYYNTEILKAAGINPKTDPRMNNSWTWENLISISTDLSKFFVSDAGRASGYGDAYALQADFDWEAIFNAVMMSYGSKVFNDDGSVAINSPQTKAMGEMIRGLREGGRILRESSSRATFNGGKCAFGFASLGPNSMDKNVQIKGKFDILSFPLIGETPYIGCGFAGWGISANVSPSKRDLCWQFLNYMISEEGQMALINAGMATPSIRVDIAENKQWAKEYENLNLDAFLVGEEYKVSSKFFTAHDPSATFDIMTAIQDMMKNFSDSTKSVDACIKLSAEELSEATSR